MRLVSATALSLLLAIPGIAAEPADPAESTAIRAFSERVAKRHDLSADAIERLISDEARYEPAIIEAINRPAEALPWHRYRDIFLTEARIAGGLEFRRRHQQWLEAVETQYGVPAEIVVAIIGVETFYGRYTGDYRVIDALRTLGFGYPARGEFFRDELEAFLVLTREEDIDPTTPLGSYAGAMGVPQFISSSYRAYAIDFNDNGRRDLFSEPADAIGSVGHYLSRHGWQAGAPIAVPAELDGSGWRSRLRPSLEPVDTVATLASAGVSPERPLAAGLDARLLELQAETGARHWVTLRNFYAITRYNHSSLYAMAVHQLADAIREAGS
ncbi:lytic murein transglycosylase B [Spiribacter vilamensis]|nr:lytic murein transglycosylase B [Spiribacter vilamensis]